MTQRQTIHWIHDIKCTIPVESPYFFKEKKMNITKFCIRIKLIRKLVFYF